MKVLEFNGEKMVEKPFYKGEQNSRLSIQFKGSGKRQGQVASVLVGRDGDVRLAYLVANITLKEFLHRHWSKT